MGCVRGWCLAAVLLAACVGVASGQRFLDVRLERIKSFDGDGFSGCGEGLINPQEEFTWFVDIQVCVGGDCTQNAGSCSLVCEQCNRDGDCEKCRDNGICPAPFSSNCDIFVDTPGAILEQNVIRIDFVAYENDDGDRCTIDDGDDCVLANEPAFEIVNTNVAPPDVTNLVDDIGNSDHNLQFSFIWGCTEGFFSLDCLPCDCAANEVCDDGATGLGTCTEVSPDPSSSPSVTPSITVSPSLSPSVSLTPSISPSTSTTPSTSPSISLSPSGSLSLTPSTSPSLSISPSVSLSPSVSATPSLTPSISTSPSVSPSISPSPSPSTSTSPSTSAAPSSSPSATFSPSPSTSTSPSPSPSSVIDNDGLGLSGGLLAGIGVGAAFAGAVCCMGVCACRRRRKRHPAIHPQASLQTRSADEIGVSVNPLFLSGQQRLQRRLADVEGQLMNKETALENAKMASFSQRSTKSSKSSKSSPGIKPITMFPNTPETPRKPHKDAKKGSKRSRVTNIQSNLEEEDFSDIASARSGSEMSWVEGVGPEDEEFSSGSDKVKKEPAPLPPQPNRSTQTTYATVREKSDSDNSRTSEENVDTKDSTRDSKESAEDSEVSEVSESNDDAAEKPIPEQMPSPKLSPRLSPRALDSNNKTMTSMDNLDDL